MSGWRSPGEFVTALAQHKLPYVFNPYADTCPSWDVKDAPAIRRANLRLYLEAALSQGVGTLWVGQELGRKGGRRTGLPLTDEPSLARLEDYWALKGLQRATIGPPVKEDTADYVWRAISHEPGRVFFWNVFPLQTYDYHDPNKNRGHTAAERTATSSALPWIIDVLRPRRLVALGRAAETALTRLGYDTAYVRHPSFGGGPTFLDNLAALRSKP